MSLFDLSVKIHEVGLKSHKVAELLIQALEFRRLSVVFIFCIYSWKRSELRNEKGVEQTQLDLALSVEMSFASAPIIVAAAVIYIY